jgi:hypothetical protein
MLLLLLLASCISWGRSSNSLHLSGIGKDRSGQYATLVPSGRVQIERLYLLYNRDKTNEDGWKTAKNMTSAIYATGSSHISGSVNVHLPSDMKKDCYYVFQLKEKGYSEPIYTKEFYLNSKNVYSLEKEPEGEDEGSSDGTDSNEKTRKRGRRLGFNWFTYTLILSFIIGTFIGGVFCKLCC